MIVFDTSLERIFRLKFGRDGTILTCSRKGVIDVWEPSTASTTPLVRIESDMLQPELELSSDGRFVAVVRAKLRLWDLDHPDKRPIIGYSGQEDAGLEGAGFIPGLHRLAIRTHGDGIQFFEYQDGQAWTHVQELPITPKPASEAIRYWPIHGCRTSPAGSILAIPFSRSIREADLTLRVRGVVCLWTMAGIMLRQLEHGDLLGGLSSLHPVFSADGSMLACATDSTLYVWNVETGAVAAKIEAQMIRDFCFSRDGTRLLVVKGGNGIHVLDVGSGAEIERIDWQIGKLNCIDVAPDGLRYAAGGSSGKVVVWDAE